MQSTNTTVDFISMRPPVPRRKQPCSVNPGAYGKRMEALLHLQTAPMVTAKTRRNTQLAVTRLRSETPLPERTKPLASEQAFSIHLHLRPVSSVRLWYGGRPVMVDPTRQKGSVSVIDLEQEPTGYMGSAFDIVQIYMPRAALDEFAYENCGRKCDTLSWVFGKIDPTLHNLGLSILPALEQPGYDALYTDHLIFAFHAYIARAYGSIRTAEPVARGGLTRWQTNRATEMLRAHLDGQICLAQVAGECRLSVSYFVRAFKQTLGRPPYRWLMEQRIEAAKDLLLHSSLPLADIALRCGFADQAGFIRAFRRTMGTPPGKWRRTRGTDPSNYFYGSDTTSKIYA